MCCGDSALFQRVFIRQRTFWILEDSVHLIFYLMNIISQSSKYFTQAHSVKATVLNLVAYIEYSSHTRSWSRHAACRTRHAWLTRANPNRFEFWIHDWVPWCWVDWALHRALVGGCKQHTMGTVGPHANAKDRVGMSWLGGAFCGRHNGKICSK